MKSFMIATFTDLFLRVILAFLLSVRYGTMGIWLSWPIGWTIAMALSLFFYKKGVWKTGSFTAREERMRKEVSWNWSQRAHFCIRKNKTSEELSPYVKNCFCTFSLKCVKNKIG